ncbi:MULTISPECIES: phosphate signaling complex protein PhoU [Chitinibacter]|uniref:phosphate signaling complex protein PhoU n=1 Tax=Chitinibacter TaxID=230666 RepID=UPI00041936BB|nr:MULTISPECIES: phosphate signaling complex protein PhoU [Chitinibacter]
MAESQHISSQFDADLNAIRSHVMAMAGLVEEQVRLSMRALATGDLAVINQVIEQETKVNAMHVELDDMCVHMIARRQPAASDLRLVMTVIKSVEDLESIGDKAHKICLRAKNIFESGKMQVPKFSDVNHIANQALEMLTRALDAFARLDAGSAADVIGADNQLDQEYRALQRQLITVMMEDPRSISLTLDILWIAKATERIGDLAVSIAEHVVYLVKGRDVRHKPLAEVEEIAKS